MSSSSATMPNEFMCPINLAVMRDPAIAPDGFTYERTAIAEWLAVHNVSPMTRQPMDASQLRSNHALRQTIEHWLDAHPMMDAVAAPPFKDAPLGISATRYTVGGSQFLRLSVAATGEQTRQPVVLICIVDNSGSMGEEATGGDGAEAFGYTRLDLVKHTIRTIAAILGPHDQLSIVTFSTAAHVVLKPTSMDATGRAAIDAALKTIDPDSQTNIYDGLRQAAVIAGAPELAGRNIVAALLTDGFPNVNPPRGILPSLMAMPTQPNWSLHTFGFGYKLDSVLLAQIAEWGKGLFGFIPDCSMVGTVFINFVANILSTASRGSTVFVDGAPVCHTGLVRHGQTFDLVVPGGSRVSLDGVNYTVAEEGVVNEFIHARHTYLATLKTMVDYASGSSLIGWRSALADSADAKVKALLADTNPSRSAWGQVAMAPDYWAKWGEHYLRSYLRAQQLQQSLNFKDAGLQIYGGEMFHAIQTEADTVFCTLPAPKPSIQKQTGYYGGAAAAPSTMATFHNASGGCFAGHCRIKMLNGSHKPIKDIAPGEAVWTPMGPAQVTALVTCGSKLRSQPMVQLDNLCITPWHPIVRKDALPSQTVWVFPADLTPYQDRLIDTVYNLVLTDGHVVECEGYECVTLGHNFQAPVVAHEFFGSGAVVKDLMKLPGWSTGRPTFVNLTTVRDEATGMICGWVDAP